MYMFVYNDNITCLYICNNIIICIDMYTKKIVYMYMYVTYFCSWGDIYKCMYIQIYMYI